MNTILNKLWFNRSVKSHSLNWIRKNSINLNYDSNEEIIITNINKVLLIGINFPDNENQLSDAMLIKLNQSFKEFNENHQYSTAVLYGIGGNLCTGVQKSANLSNCEDLLKTLSELKKPTLASINGHAKFYGFQLAMMCDIRVMETTALIGLGYKKEKDQISPIVCERLVATCGLSRALDIILTGTSMKGHDAYAFGIINKLVDCGTALGKCVNMAQGISKFPLQDIIKERNKVFSALTKVSFNI